MKLIKAAGVLAVIGLLAQPLWAQCTTPAKKESQGEKASRGSSKAHQFKLGLVLTQTDPETVFNAFRVARYSVDQGDQVSVFLLGKGVDLDGIKDRTFDVVGMAKEFVEAGGRIFACGTCLKMHGSKGSELCPVSTMSDLYDLIRKSDKVLTF